MKKLVIFFIATLFSNIAINAQSLPICKPSNNQELIQMNRTIAEAFAPTFVQEFGECDMDEFDFIRAFDFDGDLVSINNADNTFTGSDQPVIYYSVVWTKDNWFITYAVFHSLDYAKGHPIDDFGALFNPINQIAQIIGIFGPNCKDDWHENDMEGVITKVRRPKPNSSASVINHRMICHNGKFIVTPNELSPANTFYIQGGSHCIAESRSSFGCFTDHNNPCNPDVDGTLTYRPAIGNINPSFSRYELKSMFEQGGLWDQRNNRSTFTSAQRFIGDDFEVNSARAPWAWHGVDIKRPVASSSSNFLEISQFINKFDKYNSISISGPDCIVDHSGVSFYPTIHTAKCPAQSYRWEVSYNNGSYQYLSNSNVLSWSINFLPSWANFADVRLRVTTMDGSQFYGYADRVDVNSNCSGGGGAIMHKTFENEAQSQLEQHKDLTDINAYPNPFTNNLNLNLPESDGDYFVKIINAASGAEIVNFVETSAGSKNYDLSHLAAGIYFVQINSGTASKNIKVVKQ